MGKTTQQLSVTLSHAAIKYLDSISNRIPGRPSRSTIVNLILEGGIDMNQYPPPPDVQAELEEAVGRRLYQRN